MMTNLHPQALIDTTGLLLRGMTRSIQLGILRSSRLSLKPLISNQPPPPASTCSLTLLLSIRINHCMFRSAQRAALLSSHLKARTPIDKVRGINILPLQQKTPLVPGKMSSLFEENTPDEVKNAKVCV